MAGMAVRVWLNAWRIFLIKIKKTACLVCCICNFLCFKVWAFIVMTQCKLLSLGYDLFFDFLTQQGLAAIGVVFLNFPLFMFRLVGSLAVFFFGWKRLFRCCFGRSLPKGHHLNVLATPGHNPISGGRWRGIFYVVSHTRHNVWSCASRESTILADSGGILSVRSSNAVPEQWCSGMSIWGSD